MERLRNRIAIVTGGGAGIGGATAERLAAEGASVIVADIDADAANQVAARIREAGGEATAVPTDVADEAQIAAMVDACVAAYGRVDILVNNVGVAIHGGVTGLSTDDWHRVVDVNLRSMWLAMKHAIPHMPDSGGA